MDLIAYYKNNYSLTGNNQQKFSSNMERFFKKKRKKSKEKHRRKSKRPRGQKENLQYMYVCNWNGREKGIEDRQEQDWKRNGGEISKLKEKNQAIAAEHPTS